MSRSEKQREASRRNGAKSRGPKTPAGKQRSSLNARTHGMLAQGILLDNEDPDIFRELSDEFFDKFQPADMVEVGYVEEMIACHWRLRRLWAIETRLLDRELARALDEDEYERLATAFESLAGKPGFNLDNLHRYETRLHRMFTRAQNSLLKLRAARAEPQPPEPGPVPSTPGPGIHAVPKEPEIHPLPHVAQLAPNPAPDAAAEIHSAFRIHRQNLLPNEPERLPGRPLFSSLFRVNACSSSKAA